MRFILDITTAGGVVTPTVIAENIREAITRQMQNTGLSGDDDAGHVESFTVHHSPDRPKPIRIRCQDRLNNVSYVGKHDRRGWACTLANGTPAGMSYAGIPSNLEMEIVFALDDAMSPEACLAIMRKHGTSTYSLV